MSVRIALGGSAREAAERVVLHLVEQKVASRITASDTTLWPDGAPSLAWTESVAGSVPLIEQLHGLRHELRHEHLTRAVVPVATGSTLAAAMIARTAGLEVDGMVEDLRGAVIVVERSDDDSATDAARSLRDAGADPRRLVLLQGSVRSGAGDPSQQSLDASIVTFDAPLLTGADGAFSAAALVPAGLAGADLHELLDEAESESLNLAIDDPSNNGLLLGAALAAAAEDGVAIRADGTHVIGFPVWAARLLAEVAGGVALDAELESDEAIGGDGPAASDGFVVRIVEDAGVGAAEGEVLVSGTLGEMMLLWMYATTVASVLAASSTS